MLKVVIENNGRNSEDVGFAMFLRESTELLSFSSSQSDDGEVRRGRKLKREEAEKSLEDARKTDENLVVHRPQLLQPGLFHVVLEFLLMFL